MEKNDENMRDILAKCPRERRDCEFRKFMHANLRADYMDQFTYFMIKRFGSKHWKLAAAIKLKRNADKRSTGACSSTDERFTIASKWVLHSRRLAIGSDLVAATMILLTKSPRRRKIWFLVRLIRSSSRLHKSLALLQFCYYSFPFYFGLPSYSSLFLADCVVVVAAFVYRVIF